jgi:enterochelin esterase-like enzyme/sugar lactone lactonase YvrE
MKKYYRSFIILIFLGGSACYAQDADTGKIPFGRIESFQFKESRIFPGTMRDVTVYIPDQIDSSKPACVYVQQDGFYPERKFNRILDTLIAKKEIPVIVGIFISPGYVPSADKNTFGRPNRCFEYDGVGNNYVRFLLEEILPYVTKKYRLNLSNNGSDRCIGGGSSGGIAAFNAAWERPDSFSRVYCFSGSFVAFRGGNEFPALIRKTEAKPIRVFLTTGTNDMENCAGDWTLIDMEIAKALKFSGYDYRFNLLNGGHVVGWVELFADAMRYLWKDWPAPVQAGPGAPRVCDIILPKESWETAAEGYNDVCGLACNSKGEVFFTDIINNKIYRIGLDNNLKVFAADAGHCNGLSFGAGDELYSISAKTGKIMCYDTSGKRSVYAEGVHGNYILAIPGGGLYVTGNDAADKPGKVWLIKKNEKKVVDTGEKFTGLAITPDRQFLAAADGLSHWAFSYQIANDGTLSNKERFFWLYTQDWSNSSDAQSICYDREGHLYIATSSGIQVCTWDGPTQVILPLPVGSRVNSICFGGANLDEIFASCGDKVYKRKLKTHGLGAFTPWTKMTPGQL